MKRKKVLKKVVIALICLILAGAAGAMGVNAYVKGSTRDMIITSDEAAKENADCIIVLGCQVHSNGVPSHMLEDRLSRGVELYKSGAAPKLLMSGDHGRQEYNEVAAMKQFAIDRGVPSQDVFMDHAGFSTYDSLYRARDIFGAKKVIIVSQKYHLYRALYIADSLGLDACGVTADYRTYVGQKQRDVREVLARCKDFCSAIIKPKPKYLGEAIPISGDGNVTQD